MLFNYPVCVRLDSVVSHKQITTVNLETTFMAKLEQYTPNIMSLVSLRGGAAKLKTEHIRNMLLEI